VTITANLNGVVWMAVEDIRWDSLGLHDSDEWQADVEAAVAVRLGDVPFVVEKVTVVMWKSWQRRRMRTWADDGGR